jgi:hypothetical protein
MSSFVNLETRMKGPLVDANLKYEDKSSHKAPVTDYRKRDITVINEDDLQVNRKQNPSQK